jgi:DNA-binding phage protein
MHNMNYDETLNLVREALKDRKIWIVAKAVKLSRMTVSRVVSGKGKPTRANLYAIAKHLGVNTDAS